MQGLIFVVDSNDRERATEAREELTKMVCLVILIFFSYKTFNEIFVIQSCRCCQQQSPLLFRLRRIIQVIVCKSHS